MISTTKKPVQVAACAAAAVALALCLAACDQRPSAERASKDMNRGMQNAGREIDQGADKVGQKLDQTGDAITEKAAQAGKAVDDVAVVAKVKSALIAEPDLKSAAIDVDAKEGVVTLNGTAKSYSDRDKAVHLAMNVDGVKSVKNNLVIAKGT